jgi:hypothetical protein
MKHTYSIVSLIGIVGVLTFSSALALAQSDMSQSEPAAQSSQGAPSQTDSGAGMGMMNGGQMMGGQGMMGGERMMGGRQMMGMPMMMPGCPYGMMGPMMGTGKDLKTAARMMEMHADMMKASAAIMEKYAKDMEGGK